MASKVQVKYRPKYHVATKSFRYVLRSKIKGTTTNSDSSVKWPLKWCVHVWSIEIINLNKLTDRQCYWNMCCYCYAVLPSNDQMHSVTFLSSGVNNTLYVVGRPAPTLW